MKNIQCTISLLVILLFFAFSNLNAQCPGGITASGPIQFGDVGTCTPMGGMLQWDGTDYQMYDPVSGTWENLLSGTSSGSGPFIPNANGDHYDEINGDNVGIGINLPTSKLHVSSVMSGDQTSAQKIDFQNTADLNGSYGLLSEGALKTNRGWQSGVMGITSASFGDNIGEAKGFVGYSLTAHSHGTFRGVIGHVKSTSLGTLNSAMTSTLIGGSFAVLSDTDITLDNGIFWVAGVKADLNGTINNTPINGAVAAVIGRDNNQGTAQSWAGYFEGKGHFSDKVAIGTTTIPTMAGSINVSNFNLFVTGGILTEEVIVQLETTWADYVFAPDYDLKSLEEVEAIIEEKGHLHNTPSGQEIQENGIEVGKMMVNQQEKIEELFLHLIDMKKDMDALKAENVALKAEVKSLQE